MRTAFAFMIIALLSVANLQAAIELDWDDNKESDLKGYNIYRSTSKNIDVTKSSAVKFVTKSTWLDSSVQVGKTYFYVVTAIDDAGNESGPSNEASAYVPNERIIKIKLSSGDADITLAGSDQIPTLDKDGYSVFSSLDPKKDQIIQFTVQHAVTWLCSWKVKS